MKKMIEFLKKILQKECKHHQYEFEGIILNDVDVKAAYGVGTFLTLECLNCGKEITCFYDTIKTIAAKKKIKTLISDNKKRITKQWLSILIEDIYDFDKGK